MSDIIIVDFDGTIADFAYPDFGAPKKGAKEVLQKIKDKGFRIHILSCRTSREVNNYPIDRTDQVRKMKRYLEEHKIPYDEILNEYKPVAHAYIDDRAIGFRDNWDEIIEELESL